MHGRYSDYPDRDKIEFSKKSCWFIGISSMTY